MKKIIFALLAAGSWASADKLGLQFGWPNGVGLHYAIGDVFGIKNDLRFSLSMPIFETFNTVYLDVDLVLGHTDLLQNLALYYGAGGQFGLTFGTKTATETIPSSSYIGIHGLVGLEYSFNQTFSAFLDSKVGFAIAGTAGPINFGGITLGADLGLNFKF